MGEASNLTERETVERETVLPAGPDEVWEALTDDDRLEEWLAEEVELDPVEGGELSTRDGEDERSGVVETVVEGERLSFTWARPGGEDPSRVSFEIEPVPGGTRLRRHRDPDRRAHRPGRRGCSGSPRAIDLAPVA